MRSADEFTCLNSFTCFIALYYTTLPQPTTISHRITSHSFQLWGPLESALRPKSASSTYHQSYASRSTDIYSSWILRFWRNHGHHTWTSILTTQNPNPQLSQIWRRPFQPSKAKSPLHLSFFKHGNSSVEIGMIQEIRIGEVTISTALFLNANDSPTPFRCSSLPTSREISDTNSQWKAT